MFSLPQLFLGLLLGLLIALLAWRLRALSVSGAIAAAVTGGLHFGIGGWRWAVPLLAFFITSSAFSRLLKRRKVHLADTFAKGSRRDHGQVLANGGLGLVLLAVQVNMPTQPWPWIAFLGAMAAVTADTWATELGALSKAPPRLVTTGRVVPRGISGGVTVLGLGASLAGGALIAASVFIFPVPNPVFIFLSVMFAGLIASLVDSMLGATLQAMFYCPACDKITEQHPAHTCGSPTTHTRGLPWLNNDLVNLLAAVIGAAFSLLLSLR